MVLPVDRVLADVAQGVVHPAHVPLQPEAETAGAGRLGDSGPGGGLLGDGHDARHPLVGRGVGLLEQADRLEVLTPAELVGQPLAVLAGVVEVEHRGDGVDPQAVDVELLEPVDGVGDQEVAHLHPAEVEDVGAPVGLVPAPRVGVLVERLAVELRQGPGVAREVGRHPVEDDADTRLVEPVDEVAEVVGTAEPRRGGVVPGDLVAPGRPVRVLHHREELDVGEAEVGDVVDQVLGEVAVALVLAPRAEVDFVDAHRAGVRVRGATALHPAVVGPLVLRPGHDRAGRRRGLRGLGHGVGLGAHDVVGAADLVLVARALADSRHEELPDPGLAQQAHRVPDRVPAVEVSDDVHGTGAGRPHRERRAAHRAHRPSYSRTCAPRTVQSCS